jgi:hypothetical protein
LTLRDIWKSAWSTLRGQVYDECILCSGNFVEGILAQAKEDLGLKYRLNAEGYDFDKVVDRV